MNDVCPGTSIDVRKGEIRLYRALSLSLCAIFSAVGILFLVLPDAPLRFFNDLSPLLGMPPLHPRGMGFYLVLGVGYMYVVSLLAFLMYRHPADRSLPFLLVNAKGASALVSALLFLIHGAYLIYAVNAVVDGLIAIGVALLARRFQRGPA